MCSIKFSIVSLKSSGEQNSHARFWLTISIIFFWSCISFGQSKVIDEEVIQSNDGTRDYIIAKSLTVQPPNSSQSVIYTATSSVTYVFRMANPDGQHFPPSNDQNFVRTETVLVGGITSETSIKSLSVDQKQASFHYIDGLGRKLQDVTVQGSAGLNDLVIPFKYDAFGRMPKEYLPFTTSGKGAFQPANENGTLSFYQNPPPGVPNDSRPYKENIFESSPLDRVTESFGPGIAWKDVTVSKSVTSLTKVNTAAENIPRWNYLVSGIPSRNGTYPGNQLAVQETIDEEGQITKAYLDMRGLVVLKRVGDGSNWFDTHYIYSPAGLLMVVIQPEGVARLSSEFDNGDKQSFLNRWCFQYLYDDEQRMTAKRLAGWDPGYWASTVFDKWNRVVFSQTPAQKQRSEWTYNKYDRFNRVIITGLYASSSDRQTLQTNVNSYYNSYPNNRFEDWQNNATGYSLNVTFPVSPAESTLISVVYYDHYFFKDYTGWDAEGSSTDYDFVNLTGYPQYNATPSQSSILHQAKGYVTGSKIRVLGDTRWLNNISWYDKKYRAVQVIAENFVGGRDRQTTDFDFIGKPLKTQAYHTSSAITLTTLREFEYDHAGRLTNLFQTLNSGPRILILSNVYNEIGQLIEKNVHSTDNGASFLQSIDMRYNIRGWLTSINNSSLSNDGSINNDENDLFGMELLYNPTNTPSISGYPGGSIPKRYNGNIAAIKWKADTKEPGVTPKERIYGFEYDILSRMNGAYYAESIDGAWTDNTGLFNERIKSYDRNGNIKGIDRQGKIDGVSQPIDNTTYGFNYTASTLPNFQGESNRLLNISDLGNDYGFKDEAAQLGEEYQYDASGNLIYDHNKSISSITYNHLNLPTVIAFTRPSGSVDRIVYTYDATGRKIKMDVYKNGTSGNYGTRVWTTEYAGEVQYSQPQNEGSRKLSFVQTPEGRAVKNDTDFDYEYFYKDHQGNVRLTYGSLKETASYRATMEDPLTSTLGDNEEATFANIGSTRHLDVLLNYTKSSSEVLVPDRSSRVNGYLGNPIGPAKSIHLQSGDKVKMEAFAKYTQTTGSTATIAASTLVAALATSTFGYGSGETAFGSFNNNAPIIPGIGGASSTLPKAYLAYLFFDDNFGFVTSSAVSITTSAFNAFEKLERTFTAGQSGYLYVYVANETNTSPGIVYFDEMLIVHQKNTNALQVTQASDYYPFGLAFNTYQANRIGNDFSVVDKNKLKFQGKERENESEWDDFGARMYSAELGRWNQTDQAAGDYYSFSPYVGMGNNPILFLDPDGKRLYFSAGAGHDPENTGYIQKILRSFAEHGNIHNTVDIDAHARPLLGIPRDALWSIGDYSQRPYYDLNNTTAVGFGQAVTEKVTESNVNWRIKSTVDQIRTDMANNPLAVNEQFNLTGYSTGAVIMAQSALLLAKQGQIIDNLILIGPTFTKDSNLFEALSSNENIKNIIYLNIKDDNVIEGYGALKSFVEKGDSHPHFKYAFGKDADENRKALSLILKTLGVSDYNKD